MITPSEQTYTEPVASLMRLGDVRGESEWRDYLALGFTEEHVPDLRRMILDRALFWADSDSDEVWSAIHAWRVLAQLKAVSALPCLIELLGRVDEYNDDWTSEDLPEVFAYLGRPALESLQTFLADPRYGTWSLAAAGNGLVKLAERHPDLRAECVAALSQRLENFARQDPDLNAILVSDLIDLKGVEAAPVIEQAFAANKVDLLMQGDWEDVQIYLGLLDKRTTPSPNNRALMMKRMGLDPADLLTRPSKEDQAKQQGKAKRQSAKRTKSKAKAKRKQAKKSRKKQRRRK